MASEFVYLDYLGLKEVYAWLALYGFRDEEIEYIWEKVGGNNYLLSRIMKAKKEREDWRAIIEMEIEQAKGIITDFLNGIEERSLRKEVYNFLKRMIEQGKDREKLRIELESDIKPVIKILVDNEILFFDPLRAELWIQFKTYYYAMQELFKY